MRRHSFVRVFALGLLAVLFTACDRQGCPDDHLRLDRLLGGGVPVCLGGVYNQLNAYSNRDQSDPTASIAEFTIREGGVEYTYQPGGGIDLIAVHPFGKIVAACVSFTPDDSARAAVVAHRMMAKLGGEWQPVTAPEDVRRWVREDSLTVGYRHRDGTATCLRTAPP